jgi:RNA polymerase sigma-70 factor, ECF subfamily
MLAAILDQIFRRESGRVLATLIRHLGDFDLAEDALQDAFAKALQTWPRDGIPDNPAAWLTTVARRRSLDLVRRRKNEPIPLANLPDLAARAPIEDGADDGIADDRLRLLFTCCHPSLNQAAQVGLALRTLGGLTTREIARAYVEPEATTSQRLVRAKAKIRRASIPYAIPSPEDLPARLAAVLEVVYLVFNEGYAATDAEPFLRPDLCLEAIRLSRLIVEHMPGEPEAHGLLALMLLHEARRPARIRDGELVPLEQQDRSTWDQVAIQEGKATLDANLAARRPGPYQIQAAIACLHCTAATADATDWEQIAALYKALLRYLPTPVVELNAAVAHAMAGRMDIGMDWIAALEARGDLDGYYLLPAAKADLLRRAGWPGAADEYRKALRLVTAPMERRYLIRRLTDLGEPPV